MIKIQEEILDLVQTFQTAVINLSAHLIERKETDASAIEDAQFVIGMAQMNSLLLLDLIGRDESFYAENEKAIEDIVLATSPFARELKMSGFGV